MNTAGTFVLSPRRIRGRHSQRTPARRAVNVTWLHIYITDDSRLVYCLYEAPSPKAIHKVSRCTGWPIHRINQVSIRAMPWSTQRDG